MKHINKMIQIVRTATMTNNHQTYANGFCYVQCLITIQIRHMTTRNSYFEYIFATTPSNREYEGQKSA